MSVIPFPQPKEKPIGPEFTEEENEALKELEAFVKEHSMCNTNLDKYDVCSSFFAWFYEGKASLPYKSLVLTVTEAHYDVSEWDYHADNWKEVLRTTNFALAIVAFVRKVPR